jgi:hypothetical protein
MIAEFILYLKQIRGKIMNTDIRVAIGFKNHPKTKKLNKVLGADGVLSLIYLWTYTGQHCYKTGLLDGLDESDIAEESGWKGKPEVFINALVSIGFLDRTPQGYQIHDWIKENPYCTQSDERHERAMKAAEASAKARAGIKDEPKEPKPDIPEDKDEYLEGDKQDAEQDAEHIAKHDAEHGSIEMLRAPDPDPDPDPDPVLILNHPEANQEPANFSNLPDIVSKLENLKGGKEINELFPVNQSPALLGKYHDETIERDNLQKNLEFFEKNRLALIELERVSSTMSIHDWMPLLRRLRVDKEAFNMWESFKNIGIQWLLNPTTNDPHPEHNYHWETIADR